MKTKSKHIWTEEEMQREEEFYQEFEDAIMKCKVDVRLEERMSINEDNPLDIEKCIDGNNKSIIRKNK
jgi:hypothetical protein